MNICSQCVMDDTDSNISFDSKGICDHCNTFKLKIEPFWKNDNSNIDYILNLSKKIKSENSNKDFDCIIGMSGVLIVHTLYVTKNSKFKTISISCRCRLEF